MNESLRNACRTGVTFRCVTDDEDRFPLGTSRLGGRPDLPADERWPVARTRSFHEEFSLSHAFIGQIALTDIAALAEELPRDGLLSFFMLDQLRIHNSGGWQGGELLENAVATCVLYTPIGVPLVRRDIPTEVPQSHHLPAKKLAFGTATTWPQLESNVISHASEPRAGTIVLSAEEYDDWSANAPENPSLQLLGHPCGCEFPIGDDVSSRLLLSLESNPTGLPWELFGRNGFVFFRIQGGALREGRWSAVRHKEW